MSTEKENAIKIITDTLSESAYLIKSNSTQDVIFNIKKFAKTEFNLDFSESDVENILARINNKINISILKLRNKNILAAIKKSLDYINFLKKDLENLNKILNLSTNIKSFNVWGRADFHIDIQNSIELLEHKIRETKTRIKENLSSLRYDDTYLVSTHPSYCESVIKSVTYYLDEGDDYFTVKNEWDSKRGGDIYYINDEYYY